ncbi:MAG: hypothetical protein CL933_07660 [Deltaproteobacteria bacterium]|nr:hypothetical protein [Deltaproteobacteria bacterium]
MLEREISVITKSESARRAVPIATRRFGWRSDHRLAISRVLAFARASQPALYRQNVATTGSATLTPIWRRRSLPVRRRQRQALQIETQMAAELAPTATQPSASYLCVSRPSKYK